MPALLQSLSNSTPTVRRALIQDVEGNLTLSNVPIPKLGPQDVLVQVHAVGLNPTDYKMPAYFTSPGALGGCDFAGIVVAVGSKSSRVRVGERVCGAVHGSNPIDHTSGSFTDFVRCSSELLARIPQSVGYETAAGLGGVGHGTCALAIWECLGLEGSPDNPITEQKSVLVYGGSTATGTMAIQMLKMSGYSPIAICSARNFALAESFGASACFDYVSPSCGSMIRQATRNELKYALDCISDEQSAAICYEAIGRAGGHYVCLEMVTGEILAKRKAIKAEFLMGYDIYGKEIALSRGYERAPNVQRRAAGGRWFRTFEKLLAKDQIKSHPVEMSGSGIEDVPASLARLKRGEVSGRKLVVAF